MSALVDTRPRVDRVREAARARGLDAVLVTSDASIAYLTGFHPLQFERLFAVAVRADGGGAFVVPALDGSGAAALPHGLDTVAYEAASDGLPELLGALGPATRVGVDEHHLVLGRARALEAAGRELVEAGDVVMAERVRKDADEVERMRRALGAVGETMEQMFASLRPGVVERELNAQVETWLRERGATAAHALVLFGPDAANPHGHPGDRRLEVGDVVCADMSAQVDGYWGDVTRCATVGPPSDWAREAWDVVTVAQRAALDAARAGASGRDVDAAQRRVVEAAGHLGRCLHGAGHAIGLEVHEPPFLVPRWSEPLVAGTALTIEPGIYRDGVGGLRLEDQVVVTDGAVEVLSDLPRELRELPV